jgi:hypothetical protein
MTAAMAMNRPTDIKRFTGNVTIELGDNRNREMVFGPTKEIYRGRFLQANLFHDEVSTDGFANTPDVPGIWLSVDGMKRTLSVIDPLTLPQFANHWRMIKDFFKLVMHLPPEHEVSLQEAKVIENARDTQIKSWLWWMRRLVDGTPAKMDKYNRRILEGGPQANVISGTLPTRNEIIALPGKRACEFFNSRGARFLEDMEQEQTRREWWQEGQ